MTHHLIKLRFNLFCSFMWVSHNHLIQIQLYYHFLLWNDIIPSTWLYYYGRQTTAVTVPFYVWYAHHCFSSPFTILFHCVHQAQSNKKPYRCNLLCSVCYFAEIFFFHMASQKINKYKNITMVEKSSQLGNVKLADIQHPSITPPCTYAFWHSL